MGESAQNILRFENVTVAAGRDYDCGLSEASFNIGAGELVLVRLQREATDVPLADAAEGLVDLVCGAVFIDDEDWRRMRARKAEAQRGLIGRVFAERSWVSNLDVDENITLSQRHHTDRPVRELLREAIELAHSFGVDELPHGRPGHVPRQVLRRLCWTRAMLGGPRLLLLERPTLGVPPAMHEPLVRAVESARSRAAGVLWTTADTEEFADPRIRPTMRYTMVGERLQPDIQEAQDGHSVQVPLRQ